MTELIITPGGACRFGGYEPSSLGPIDMVAVDQFELRTLTPLPGRMKTPPNPTDVATNPCKWRRLQQQLACLYENLVNIGDTDALMGSTDHLFWLLITDGGVLMSTSLADQVTSRTYGALRAKAESIVTGVRVSIRCNALGATDVRERLQPGRHRVDIPDIRPNWDSNFVLARTLDHETHKDKVFIREFAGGRTSPISQRRPPQWT